MMKARGAEYDSLYGAALLCLHGSIAGAEAFPYGLTGEVLLRPAAPSGYGSIPRRMAARSVPVKIVQKCAGLLQSRPVRFEIPSGMAPYGLALSENGMPLGRFGFGRSTGASDRPVSGEVSAKPAGADNAVLAEVRVPELGLDITAESRRSLIRGRRRGRRRLSPAARLLAMLPDPPHPLPGLHRMAKSRLPAQMGRAKSRTRLRERPERIRRWFPARGWSARSRRPATLP